MIGLQKSFFFIICTDSYSKHHSYQVLDLQQAIESADPLYETKWGKKGWFYY